MRWLGRRGGGGLSSSPFQLSKSHRASRELVALAATARTVLRIEAVKVVSILTSTLTLTLHSLF